MCISGGVDTIEKSQERICIGRVYHRGSQRGETPAISRPVPGGDREVRVVISTVAKGCLVRH